MIERSGRSHPCKVLVLLLAGVTVALTAVVVLHQLQHLSGAVPVSRACPICVWAHAVLAGLKVCIGLLWGLLLLGISVPERLTTLPLDFLLGIASRAPPAPA